jgi:TPR repeat protein
VSKNDIESVKWYRRSANQGDPDGLFNLGGVYYYGSQGIPKDPMKAYKLYILAASVGHSDAKKSYETAAKLLTREQVDTVQQACEDWKPKLETENP